MVGPRSRRPGNAVAPPFFIVVALPEGPGLAFQKVDDPTPGKNRVHIDFSAADIEAEVNGWSAGRQRNRQAAASASSVGGARRSGRQRVLRRRRLAHDPRARGRPRIGQAQTRLAA